MDGTQSNILLEDDVEPKLQSITLKAIIKENHGKEIYQICFNRSVEEYGNLVATVGEAQANIYDNEHFGNHLDLFMHFINKPTPFTKKGVSFNLRTCAWIRENEGPSELREDAYLAVAGEDQLIHIISIKRSKVITILKGHTDTIVDLIAHPSKAQYLLSVSNDNTIRLWDIHARKPFPNCVQTWEMAATVAAFSSDGIKFFAGGSNGSVLQFEITYFSGTSNLTPIVLKAEKRHHTHHIDCIKFLEDKLVTKSTDGRILIWSPETGKISVEMKIPDSKQLSSRFDLSRDGRFLCVGNGEGIAYIFRTEDGGLVKRVEYRRSKVPIKCCVFNRDSTNLLYVTNDSHIWRFAYVDPEEIRKFEEEQRQLQERQQQQPLVSETENNVEGSIFVS